MIQYSFILRSIGEKHFHRQTITAMLRQSIAPAEIIIVIPEDVNRWDVHSSLVRFVTSKRGMVSQRAKGIQEAKTRYAILLDDDIAVASDTSERLLHTLIENDAKCAVPYSELSFSAKAITRLVAAFFGIAIPSKSGGIRYTMGGGFYYPKAPPDTAVATEGGLGAAIAIDADFFQSRSITGDYDLERFSPYALREDGALVYSVCVAGGKCLMVPNVSFDHLGEEARSTRARHFNAGLASVVNQLIFWKKMILNYKAKSSWDIVLSYLAICWYMIGLVLICPARFFKYGTIAHMLGMFAGFCQVPRILTIISNENLQRRT